MTFGSSISMYFMMDTLHSFWASSLVRVSMLIFFEQEPRRAHSEKPYAALDTRQSTDSWHSSQTNNLPEHAHLTQNCSLLPPLCVVYRVEAPPAFQRPPATAHLRRRRAAEAPTWPAKGPSCGVAPPGSEPPRRCVRCVRCTGGSVA